MTYFDRARVSPADTIWDKPNRTNRDAGLPAWQYATDPIAAPPVNARPFLLTGAAGLAVNPFEQVPVPGLSLEIPSGFIAIVRYLNVWNLRGGGTLDQPRPLKLWSLNLDGVPVGDGYEAVYTFGVGGAAVGVNGLWSWPVELRIPAGVLSVTFTCTNTDFGGSTFQFSGFVSGWMYPEELDLQLSR